MLHISAKAWRQMHGRFVHRSCFSI